MIPENEQGVIVEFAKCAEYHGFDITSIQGSFPDAIISKDGTEYRTEFEFSASNFRQHGHDIRKCDIVICWENDLGRFPLPILALADPNWASTPLALPSDLEREAEYWKQRALSAEQKLKQAEQGKFLKTMRALNRKEQIDLTEEQTRVLAWYSEHPGASFQVAADALDLSKTRVWNRVKELERAGVIKRNGHVEVL